MNDRSHITRPFYMNSSYICQPVPNYVLLILTPLLFVSLAFSIFIYAAVHNPVLFVCILLIVSVVFIFIFWNIWNFRRNKAFLFFISGFPHTDLSQAKDGELVKITGLVSCEDASLVSSYEKVPGCVYTSATLYEGWKLGPVLSKLTPKCFRWTLVYSERVAADFFLTDAKSGLKALVKAGHSSKIIPLISEITLVHATSSNTIFSSYLKKWLHERNLSTQSRIVRLDEGYVQEGSSLTVLGLLHRHDGGAVIVQPPTFSTGCLWLKFLLPIEFDALILRLPDRITSQTAAAHVSQAAQSLL